MAKYEYKYRPPQRRHIKMHLVLIVLAVLLLAVYPFVEARMLTLKEHTLYVNGLPSNLKNIRIAYASDIHQRWWNGEKRIEKVFATLNNMSPDIIILGGDYAVDFETAVAFFENAPRLHARLGVFAVMGNHEYIGENIDLKRLTDAMKDAGVTPLVNDVARVKVGQSYIYIAGADEHSGSRADVAGLASQVYTNDFVIFAGHDPSLMLDAQKAADHNGSSHWFDLALFGHTHGGQVNLFGYTPLRNVAPELSDRYITGWLEENRAGVLVSNGVGTSGLPVRLFAQPQVHLITLKAR